MPEDRIKVGFIGCGGIARSVYTGIYAALPELAQVVAVADLVDDLAENRRQVLQDAYRATAYGARAEADRARAAEVRDAALRKAAAADSAAAYDIRKYGSHEELLRDDELDMVCVLTPPSIRALPIVAAAEAGKHVFSEGPFAKSVEEADSIVAAIKKAGVKFHSQVMDRYPRGMVVAHHAIQRGLLGELGSASVELNSYRGQAYYGPVDESGRGFLPKTWHGTWEGEGGGAVFHHGRYIIDPFLWVVGSRVKEVFAYSGSMFRTIEHESLTQAIVKFENGATGAIHASLVNHLSGSIPGLRGRITLLGSDAAIEIDQEYTLLDQAHSNLIVASQDNPEAAEAIQALQVELADYPEFITQEDQTRLFLESIVNDTEPLVPIEVPRHHVEVTRAIYQSAVEGGPVTLPLDKSSPFYSFEGKLSGGGATSPARFSSGHPFRAS